MGPHKYPHNLLIILCYFIFRQGDKNTDLLTLSIYDQNKAMIMGSSKDLGWCKGRSVLRIRV